MTEAGLDPAKDVGVVQRAVDIREQLLDADDLRAAANRDAAAAARR